MLYECLYSRLSKKLMDKKVLHTVPESQDSWGWKGHLRWSIPILLWKKQPVEKAPQSCLQSGSSYLQNGDSMTSLGNLFQGLINLTLKIFSYIRFIWLSVQLTIWGASESSTICTRHNVYCPASIWNEEEVVELGHKPY